VLRLLLGKAKENPICNRVTVFLSQSQTVNLYHDFSTMDKYMNLKYFVLLSVEFVLRN